MELIQLPEWLMWIRTIPWYLFAPTVGVISIVGGILFGCLVMKWLKLAFGYKED